MSRKNLSINKKSKTQKIYPNKKLKNIISLEDKNNIELNSTQLLIKPLKYILKKTQKMISLKLYAINHIKILKICSQINYLFVKH